MKLKNAEFTVGLFALLALGAIIFMSLQVNQHRSLGISSKEYYADFESVSGLVPKIPIEIAGIVSGYIEKIELVGNKARVTVHIRKDIEVHDDAALFIRDRGALGDRYVMLNPGSIDHPVLPDGGQILYTESQSDFEKLSRTLAETGETLRELVKSDNPQGALGQTIVHLRNMTASLDEIVSQNKGSINETIESLRSLTYQLNQISLENREQIHETIASINEVMRKINQGEGSLGQLINDDTTVKNLNQTLDNVNSTVGLFNRVQLKFRYRGEFLLSNSKLQNLFGVIIAPGPDKYILVELVDSPKGDISVSNTTITSGGTTTSTQTIQNNTGITFTVMFAKRFWDATLRVGLIRSQGGVALDYHFFKDRLIVSAEAFDLNRPNNKSQVRLYGTMYLYQHLILTGGVDDLLNELGGMNPFFGLGLQFTDNDFKALLPAVSRSGP